MLERAAILADTDVISLVAPPARPAAAAPSLVAAETAAIRAALDLHGGNRRRAAEHLGIGERTLYDKLKAYGLS